MLAVFAGSSAVQRIVAVLVSALPSEVSVRLTLTTTPYELTGQSGERTHPFLSSTWPEASCRSMPMRALTARPSLPSITPLTEMLPSAAAVPMSGRSNAPRTARTARSTRDRDVMPTDIPDGAVGRWLGSPGEQPGERTHLRSRAGRRRRRDHHGPVSGPRPAGREQARPDPGERRRPQRRAG